MARMAPAWIEMLNRSLRWPSQCWAISRCPVLEIGRNSVMPSMRSEEHTSELQSLMRISYAVFCLKKKKTNNNHPRHTTHSLHTDSQTNATHRRAIQNEQHL